MVVEGADSDQHDCPWSDILCELLELIFNRLDFVLLDSIRFGAVCRSWRSVLLENFVVPHPSVPLLLLPIEVNGEPVRKLLDPTNDRFYNISPLPVAKNRVIMGSFGSWILTMDCSIPSSHEIELFNLITRAHIPLPPATTFESFQRTLDNRYPLRHFIAKVFVFSSPNTGCIVMATHGCRRHLAFCRVGDKKWTNFQNTETFTHTMDVIYHKSRFYGVTQMAVILDCELDPVPKMVEVAQLPKRARERNYLLELSGELLMVTRYRGLDDFRVTTKFTIEKLDVGSDNWEEVTSFNDHVIFLGNSFSISISSVEINGCKPNCIYFVDDYGEGYKDRGCFDMGIYNFGDKKISAFYSPDKFLRWPMFWVTPTLQITYSASPSSV